MRLRLLLCGVALAFATTASAQTPFATENVGKAKGSGTTTESVSAANPWLGAQIAYKFGGTNDLADNLLVSAHFLYDVDLGTDRFHLPVMGNFSNLALDANGKATTADQITQKVQELLTSTSGMRFGVYPYFLAKKTTTFTMVIHGELAWKLNTVTDDTTKAVTYLDQSRYAGGVEFGLGKTTEGRLPLTISFTPVLTKLNSADAQKLLGLSSDQIKSFEITGVLPIAPRMGILFEKIVAQNGNRSFRAAIVIASGTK